MHGEYMWSCGWYDIHSCINRTPSLDSLENRNTELTTCRGISGIPLWRQWRDIIRGSVISPRRLLPVFGVAGGFYSGGVWVGPGVFGAFDRCAM